MRSENEYFKWVLALTAAIAWHALLWQWIDKSEAAPIRHIRPRPPRMAYIPNLGGTMPASAEGDLMTPVLFALPSSFGFSQPLSEDSANMIEEIGPGADEVALLEAPLQQRSGELLRWPRHMDRQIATLLADPTLNRPREVLTPEPSTEVLAPVHLRLEGAISTIEFDRREFDASKIPVAGSPWQLRLAIDFDPSGIPRHIFIMDSSAPAEVDEAVLLQINRWRLPPARSARSGEILLERY